MNLACPKCRAPVAYNAALAGQTGKCPKCQAAVTMPAVDRLPGKWQRELASPPEAEVVPEQEPPSAPSRRPRGGGAMRVIGALMFLYGFLCTIIGVNLSVSTAIMDGREVYNFAAAHEKQSAMILGGAAMLGGIIFFCTGELIGRLVNLLPMQPRPRPTPPRLHREEP